MTTGCRLFGQIINTKQCKSEQTSSGENSSNEYCMFGAILSECETSVLNNLTVSETMTEAEESSPENDTGEQEIILDNTDTESKKQEKIDSDIELFVYPFIPFSVSVASEKQFNAEVELEIKNDDVQLQLNKYDIKNNIIKQTTNINIVKSEQSIENAIVIGSDEMTIEKPVVEKHTKKIVSVSSDLVDNTNKTTVKQDKAVSIIQIVDSDDDKIIPQKVNQLKSSVKAEPNQKLQADNSEKIDYFNTETEKYQTNNRILQADTYKILEAATKNDLSISENNFSLIENSIITKSVKNSEIEYTLKLTPEGLGSVTLKIKNVDDKMEISIKTATQETHDMLVKESERLIESINTQQSTDKKIINITFENKQSENFNQLENGYHNSSQNGKRNKFDDRDEDQGKYNKTKNETPITVRYGRVEYVV